MAGQNRIRWIGLLVIAAGLGCADLATDPVSIASGFVESLDSGIALGPEAQTTHDRGLVVVSDGAQTVRLNPEDGRIVSYVVDSVFQQEALPSVRRDAAWPNEAVALGRLREIAHSAGAPGEWVQTYKRFDLDREGASGRINRGVAAIRLSEVVNGLPVLNGGNSIKLEADPHTGQLVLMQSRYKVVTEGSRPDLSDSLAKQRAIEALHGDLVNAGLESVPEVASASLCYSLRYDERARPDDELDVAIKPRVARLAYEVVFEAVPDPTHREIMRNIKLYVDAENGEILWRRYNVLAKSHE